MTTSANGIEEREAKNNHGTCWFLQVAEFSRCTGNSELLSYCRDWFTSSDYQREFPERKLCRTARRVWTRKLAVAVAQRCALTKLLPSAI